MLYAIQAGETGPIKFGVAANPSSRLRELQTSNAEELRLLVELDFPDDAEKGFHFYLRRERLRGEWFRPTIRALELVEAMRAQRFSNDHILTNHMYFEDLETTVWVRRRAALGFDIFEHEKERADSMGLRYEIVAPDPKDYVPDDARP